MCWFEVDAALQGRAEMPRLLAAENMFSGGLPTQPSLIRALLCLSLRRWITKGWLCETFNGVEALMAETSRMGQR